MTTDQHIKENKTKTLSKGDKVVMHTYGEANFPENHGKIWICQTDSFMSKSNTEVVFLEGFSGYFITEFLQRVNL